MGLDMGLAVLERCDELWNFGDHISNGMWCEIQEARQLGIPVLKVNEADAAFVAVEAPEPFPEMI